MGESIKITKLDAARRQLLTAIELWFEDKDPISIHSLAYASHEIIYRLFRLKGLKGLLFDSRSIRDDRRGEFNLLLKKDANFIKHAKIDKQPDAVIEFHPFSNELYIIMSLDGLRRMGEELSPTELAFFVWQSLHRPDAFLNSIVHKDTPIDVVEKFRALGRRDFLKHFLKSWTWGSEIQ